MAEEVSFISDFYRLNRKYFRGFNYNVIKPIKNLKRWFKTIAQDRDYDDHYIWVILKKKLEYQSEYFIKHGHTMSGEYDAEKMRLCIRLIDLIEQETYTAEYMDYHVSENHWDPVEDDFVSEGFDVPKEDLVSLRIEEVSERFDEYFAKYPHAYREVTKTDKYIFDNNSKQTIAMNMGYYLHKKAKHLLFALLEQHIESWWD